MFKKLVELELWLKDSKLGGVIFKIIETLGIRIAFNKYWNYLDDRKKRNNPTMDMQKTREYYVSREVDIQKVISYLADFASKDCYQKMCRFRWTYNYEDLPRYKYRTQYFINDFFQYQDREVFCDCGAFDGDSIQKFKQVMKKEGKKIEKIIAVEGDERNCKNLKRNHPEVFIIKGAAWNKEEKLYFSTGLGGNCKVQDGKRECGAIENIVTIQGYALDGFEECRMATFIKMDIEGAEKNALIGLKNTIINNKPKLAICIYHRDEDMIDIPLMIKEWVPEYKLYVMQHTNTAVETVLYATI